MDCDDPFSDCIRAFQSVDIEDARINLDAWWCEELEGMYSKAAGALAVSSDSSISCNHTTTGVYEITHEISEDDDVRMVITQE